MMDPVYFALLMVGTLVALVAVAFPIMTSIMMGSGIRGAVRMAPTGFLFGLRVGGYAIIPMLVGSFLGWLTMASYCAHVGL